MKSVRPNKWLKRAQVKLESFEVIVYDMTADDSIENLEDLSTLLANGALLAGEDIGVDRKYLERAEAIEKLSWEILELCDYPTWNEEIKTAPIPFKEIYEMSLRELKEARAERVAWLHPRNDHEIARTELETWKAQKRGAIPFFLVWCLISGFFNAESLFSVLPWMFE